MERCYLFFGPSYTLSARGYFMCLSLKLLVIKLIFIQSGLHIFGFQICLCLCKQAYSDYLGFILTLNDAVKGKKMSVDCSTSEVKYENTKIILIASTIYL